jgi:hypothetical protein
MTIAVSGTKSGDIEAKSCHDPVILSHLPGHVSIRRRL